MGVYEYVSRAEAEKDETGKFVKVKWVRTKKGDGVRCRLVAQELGRTEQEHHRWGQCACPHTCHEEGHPQGHGHGREVCVLVRRDSSFGVYRFAAHGSRVWGWYAGGETKEGHVRNARCAPDLAQVVRSTLYRLGHKQSVFQPAVY